MSENRLLPQQIVLHRCSHALELIFTDCAFTLPAELLRVYSPSAEVQGHGDPILQVGKRGVNVVSAQCIGHYGLKIIFDDGHGSGIFSWDYLHQLHHQQATYWQRYLTKLDQAGASRDADTQIIQLQSFIPNNDAPK